MTTMLRYTAAAGLALVLACGDSGGEQGATAQQSTRRPPPGPVDMCALLTQDEAGALLGTPAAAPQKGAGRSCTYAAESGRGQIMLHMLAQTFGSEGEFHAFLVKDTDRMNERLKKELGDKVKLSTVDPVPEVGQPAYYVDPTLIILKDGRVLSILAADRKQAVAVAEKALPRF